MFLEIKPETEYILNYNLFLNLRFILFVFMGFYFLKEIILSKKKLSQNGVTWLFIFIAMSIGSILNGYGNSFSKAHYVFIRDLFCNILFFVSGIFLYIEIKKSKK